MKPSSGAKGAAGTDTNRKSVSETGHAKNVANFYSLISFVEGYGPIYNPSKGSLTVPNLNMLLFQAQERLEIVIAKNSEFNDAVNNRMYEFASLGPLATKIINALEATDAKNETIKDAKGFNRKIQGKRVSGPPVPVNADAPVPNTISSSQQSYDQKVQHLAALIGILNIEPTYRPNETDLSIPNITEKKNSLLAKNRAVVSAYTNVNNARIFRNSTLYAPETGLVDTALDVKKYIKSLFGADSPQYKQVAGLQIKKLKT